MAVSAQGSAAVFFWLGVVLAGGGVASIAGPAVAAVCVGIFLAAIGLVGAITGGTR